MTITTTYNEGDEVWTMLKNRPVCTTIIKPNFLFCTSFEDVGWELAIREGIMGYEMPVCRLESELFKTKEELIASL